MADMHQRLKAARQDAGFGSASSAASALGVTASTYRAHENGQNEYDTQDAERYARKFNVTAAWLLTGETVEGTPRKPSPLTVPKNKSANIGTVPVLGSVKAGLWQDITEHLGASMPEYVPSAANYPLEWQFAFIVDGESVNRTARNGDWLICVDLIASQLSIAHDDLVIVERQRYGGQMIERTAKRIRKTAAGIELWPDSDHPQHQAPVPYGDGNDETRITAKVVWVLRKP